MITALLRRLRGRPDRPAPVPEAAAYVEGASGDGASMQAECTLDAATLRRLFFDWAFDLAAPDENADKAAAEAALAHLQMVAHRFDARRMPRLPTLVPQLLAALRRGAAHAAEIAGLLARDPTLAGDVMRIASSAHYARVQPPSNLRSAVQTIGNDGLRQVVLSSVLRPILRGDDGFAQRLWQLAEARTWLCGRLAGAYAAEAQLAGIIAGTGVVALSRMVHPQLLVDASGEPDFAARFIEIARPMTLRAGTHWQLPAPVLDALQGDAASPIADVLEAAERLAMGYWLIDAGWLPSDATWPSGMASTEDVAHRNRLFAAMERELEPAQASAAA